MRSIDISMPLFDRMPAFPGDPLFGAEPAHSIDRGNPYTTNVGRRELGDVPPGTERLLLRTANSGRWAQRLEFSSEYAALSLEGVEVLIERGTRLVGIDSLSIERDPSGTFPVHHRFLEFGVRILEGLILSDAPAGTYDLGRLPLRLRDGDGGPARAVLRAP